MSRRLPFGKPAVSPNGQGDSHKVDILCLGCLDRLPDIDPGFVFLEFLGLKNRVHGFGEYMTTIQLHAGKLWFAAKAENWEPAGYELHEDDVAKLTTGLNDRSSNQTMLGHHD